MTDRPYDIHKAAAIIIEDRKVITTRSRGKPFYIQPGGKLEPGESEVEALIRELNEELGISVKPDDVEKIDDFYAEAAGQPGTWLKLSAYHVQKYSGQLMPQAEVEEIRAFSSQIPDDVEIASIMLHDIIPRLKAEDLID